MFKKLLHLFVTAIILSSCYDSTPTNTRKVWADSLIIDSSGTYVNIVSRMLNSASRAEALDSAKSVVSDSLLNTARTTDFDSVRAIEADSNAVIRTDYIDRFEAVSLSINAYFPVTNANLNGSISDSKLSQITTADKVAGSAIQLNSGGSITNSTGLKIADNKVSWSMADPTLKDSIRAGYGGTPTFVNNPGGITIEDAGTDSLEIVNYSVGKTKIDSTFKYLYNIHDIGPFIDTTGTNFQGSRRLIRDIYLEGGSQDSTYAIYTIQRNATGTWAIRVYEQTNGVNEVCKFTTASNPEQGDSITVHVLAETNSSGVSGHVAVRWTDINDGTNWTNMGYNRLDISVCDPKHMGSSIIDNYIKQSTIDTHTSTLLTKLTYDTTNRVIKTATVIDTLFVSSHGVTEHVGASAYSQPNLGYSQQITEDISFSRIKWAVYGDATTSVRFRIYRSASEFASGTIGAGSLTLVDSVTIDAGDMSTSATSTTLQEIDLGENHFIESGQWLTVFMKKLSGTNPTIYRFTSDPNADRNNFIFVASGDPWTAAWSAASYPAYCSPPFLILNNELGDYNKSLLRGYISDGTISLFDPRLILPDTLYLSASDTTEANIFFRNIVMTSNYEELVFAVTCDSGKTYQDRWAWTPDVATTGSFAFAITVRDKNYTSLATASTVLKVASHTIGSAKTWLPFGDSITAGGGYAGEIQTNLSAADVTSVGTQGTTIKHEGIAGTTLSYWENNASSPIVNLSGDVDFDQYQIDNSIADPNYVTILLGINDIISSSITVTNIETQINTFISYADSIILSIHAASANTKIGMCLTIPPAGQDAFGDDYGNYSGQFYRYKLHRWWERLKAYYGTGGTGELAYVTIVPVYLGIDTMHNFPSTASTQYNRRNSTDTYTMQSNAVHPASSGYMQIADQIYGWIVNH